MPRIRLSVLKQGRGMDVSTKFSDSDLGCTKALIYIYSICGPNFDC